MATSSNMFTLDGVMKAGTDIMGVASTSFQRAMKIQEVTSTKDENQSAFALNELVQACNRDADEARAIAGALLKKVSSTNPLVRWKALRAIRYICQNCPSTQFKKACGGPNAAVIRDSSSWTGTPHPRLGNSLNMRVREAAKETLEEVFKATAPPTSFMGNGNSVGGGGGGAASGGGGPHLKSRIQGYGSTTGGKIQGSVGSALTGFMGSGSRKYVGFGSDDVNNGTCHWQKTAASKSQSNGGSGSTYATPAASPSALSAASSTEASAVANTAAVRAAIGDEASVVGVLCKGSGGGVNPRATPEAMRLFLSQASQLDAEVIALELTHKLFNTTWQERVRALDGMHAIIEAVEARGGGHPLQGTVESLSAVTDAFKGVTDHENAAVRSAAARVLRGLKLGGGGAPQQGASAAAFDVGASAVPVDLLGGFDDDAAEHGSSALGVGAEVSTGGFGGVEDLMGDLVLPSTAPQATPKGAANGSTSTPASGAADMFSGLKVASVGSAGAVQSSAAPAAASAAPAAVNSGAAAVDLLDLGGPAEAQGGASDLDDLFKDWTAAPAAAATAGPPNPPVVEVATSTALAQPVAPLPAPQVAAPPMMQPQGLGLQPMHGMNAQPAPGQAFLGAGFPQQPSAMGVPAGAGAGAGLMQGMGMSQDGARPTQQAFMHTSGELSRVNNRDAFDFVNDAMR